MYYVVFGALGITFLVHRLMEHAFLVLLVYNLLPRSRPYSAT